MGDAIKKAADVCRSFVNCNNCIGITGKWSFCQFFSGKTSIREGAYTTRFLWFDPVLGMNFKKNRKHETTKTSGTFF